MLDLYSKVLCHSEGRFFGRDDRDPNFGDVQANTDALTIFYSGLQCS